MANQFFAKGKEGLLDGSINLETDSIRVLLLDSADFTPNFSTHDNLDDVAAAARVGTAVALASKTFSLGVFDAADVSYGSTTGDACEYLLLYKHTGTESTSRLLLLIDTATGLPTPTLSSTSVTITWNASGIFSI